MPAAPVDVLGVTGGQDHGARFGLRGSEATIGRGPVMDIVLSDPRVSRRHARVAVRDAALVVEDLASSGGTTVNGVTIAEATVVAPGDRIGVGSTELTVLWTPGGSYAPPAPPPVAPAVASAPRPSPTPAAATQPLPAVRVVARPELLLAVAALSLAGFALLAVWMPVLGTPAGTDSLWTLESTGFRVHGILAALLTAAAAGGWLVAVTAPAWAPARVALAAATGLGGGLIAGLPLFLAAIDLEGVDTEAGLVLMLLAGLAITGCAVAGVARATAGTRPARSSPAAPALVAAGGGAGGALALVASPLTWVSTATADLGGFEDGFEAGGWLVPLALAVAAASALTLAVSRSGEQRAAVCTVVVAAALGGAASAFVNGAAIGFGEFRAGAGLSLAMTGTAIALTSIAIGGAAMALRWATPRG